MSNLQAAVGLAQLKNVCKAIKFKRDMAKFYYQNLHKISGLTLPYEEKWAKSTYWMYAVLVNRKKFGMSRDQLVKKLKENYGIQTRTFFYPPNIAFKKMGIYKNEKFPISQKISQEGLYLPSGLGNTFEEFDKTCKAIKNLVK
jgi:perosamine synthetase